ncbi:DUF6973 domain-containing protein [Caldisalinibacter kiritimatiensis]|uniref:DUF6973 domain-containing protein n=1 Tax=Caldisalinibacter kiritimatiensis TaxID=1304284 RepID=R1CQ48_9FIRM|nr:hypothetical protein [Caldisalinibacter kiritimatiensis]EOD00806.1 hypothetical protein L21TH_1136 [Caldisalinibacter kiritimatiensis]
MKKILLSLLVFTLVVSGFTFSYGANSDMKYAETDEEIVQAEKMVNRILAKSEKKSKEMKFKTIKLSSVEEAVDILKKDGYPVNYNFVQLCKDIEKYKKTNKSKDTKHIVKHFNSITGLKEKPKKIKKLGLSFVDTVYAISYDDWARLTTAEKVLVVLYPAEAVIVNSCSQQAYTYTKEKFGYNGLGDKTDGYRHAMWNALMDARLDEHIAEAFSTAHEEKSEEELNQKAADGYYEYEHREMDLHNNAEGLECVSWYEIWPVLSDDTIKDRVSEKLTNKSSDIIWLHD